MKRIVVVSDVQSPYQNQRQVNALARFIKDTKPDDVLCVGDVADLPMVSRWQRGRRGEFDGQIQNHIDDVTRTLEKLQVRHLRCGNHDRRVEAYVETYAPALSPLKSLKMESMFRLDEIGTTLHRDPYEFAPNWLLFHGDEGPLSNVGGATAFKLAERTQKSVVCSHTHRQGWITRSHSLLGEQGVTLHGVEVGHMMNLKDAGYLKSGMSNWTAGFGIFDVSNSKVQPYLIQMSKTGSFIWEGRSFEDGVQRKGSSK